MFEPSRGAYPTMVTPYNADGSVDFGAAKALTEWYYSKGCAGIFAVCQSSEIHMLTLDERVKLASVVSETAAKLSMGAHRMSVVASGHVSDSFDEQVTELSSIAGTGVDAVIMISNRFDIENTCDEKWIADASRMLEAVPDIPLGIYECPRPYKRLLTPAMIDFITRSGKFAFIKDTCCDSEEIDRRIRQIENTPSPALKPALFNANAQTLLETLRSGCAGYCGIMCNFHPELYVKLCADFDRDKESTELLAAFICQAAFIESCRYPAIAKYHLNKHGINMTELSRVCDTTRLYDRICVDRMDILADTYIEKFCRE